MPLKLSVGLTKKIGLPNYSSLAASCHAEVELDNSLLQGDLDGFHRHVRNIFFSCRQAVQDELARQQQQPEAATARVFSHGNGNGQTGSSARNNRRAGRDGTRRATASQLGAIEAIAERQQLDLANLLSERFQLAAAEDLTISQASHLIDELKAPAEGNGACP